MDFSDLLSPDDFADLLLPDVSASDRDISAADRDVSAADEDLLDLLSPSVSAMGQDVSFDVEASASSSPPAKKKRRRVWHDSNGVRHFVFYSTMQSAQSVFLFVCSVGVREFLFLL